MRRIRFTLGRLDREWYTRFAIVLAVVLLALTVTAFWMVGERLAPSKGLDGATRHYEPDSPVLLRARHYQRLTLGIGAALQTLPALVWLGLGRARGRRRVEPLRGDAEFWRAVWSASRSRGGETPMDPHHAASIVGSESPMEILGLAPGATRADVKRAYRRLIKVHHPDHGGDADAAKRIIAAYTILWGRARPSEPREQRG